MGVSLTGGKVSSEGGGGGAKSLWDTARLSVSVRFWSIRDVIHERMATPDATTMSVSTAQTTRATKRLRRTDRGRGRRAEECRHRRPRECGDSWEETPRREKITDRLRDAGCIRLRAPCGSWERGLHRLSSAGRKCRVRRYWPVPRSRRTRRGQGSATWRARHSGFP